VNRIFQLIFAMLLGLFVSVESRSEGQEPQSKLPAREQVISDLVVDYVVSEVRVKSFFDDESKEQIELKPRKSLLAPFDWESKAPDRLMIRGDCFEITNGRTKPNVLSNRMVSSPEKSLEMTYRSDEPGIGSVSKSPRLNRLSALSFQAILMNTLAPNSRFLSTPLSRLKTIGTQEIVESQTCNVFINQPEQGKESRYWVDAKTGQVRKFTTPDGVGYQNETVIYFEPIPGFHSFPTIIETTKRDLIPNRIVSKRRFSVVGVKLGADFPATAFQLDFPPGSKVTEVDSEGIEITRVQVATVDPKPSWEEAKPQDNKSQDIPGWKIWLALSVVIGSAATFWLIVRWRRNSREMTHQTT
jgi:hypothetical protein